MAVSQDIRSFQAGPSRIILREVTLAREVSEGSVCSSIIEPESREFALKGIIVVYYRLFLPYPEVFYKQKI
jgi:hypothetical protein